MTVVMCPEAKCGWKTGSPREFRPHWMSMHKLKKGQRCPRAVIIQAATPESILPNNSILMETALLDTFKGMSPQQAQLIYLKVFRQPDFVKTKILFHKQVNNNIVPLIYKHNIPVLIKYIRQNNIYIVPDEKKIILSSSSIPLMPTKPPVLSLKRKRDDTVVNFKAVDSTKSIKKLQSIQIRLNTWSSLQTRVKSLQLDESTKKILSNEINDALIISNNTTTLSPVIIISQLVHKHLGYLPVKVCDGKPVSFLFKRIGLECKKQYTQKYGKIPEKRTYQSGSQTLETNDYKGIDLIWISKIVETECDNAQVFPKTKVLMCRGIPIK
jgi:hypothetical protein